MSLPLSSDSEVQAYRETSSVSTNLGKETQITCGCKGVPLPKVNKARLGLRNFLTGRFVFSILVVFYEVHINC